MGIFDAFGLLLTGQNVFACLLGVLVGTLVGVLPGLGPVTTMALLLPFSYTMTPMAGLIMLAGVYYGAMYGGSTTSILFRVPGEASSILTSVDGYALARKGRAGATLAIAGISSFIAGTIGLIGLQLFAPPLAKFAVAFGPPEFLMIAVAGLFILANILGGGAAKNLALAMVGIIITTIGLEAMSGFPRFTFGSFQLLSGFDMVPVIMGLYGISEMIDLAIKPTTAEQVYKVRLRDIYPSRQEFTESVGPMVRSGPIGFLVGLMPGPATVVAPFVSYYLEKKISKRPEEFGRGSMAAVASAEGANNSACMGAMVPLLALGVPLTPAAAMLLGGLLIHGVTPGPAMMSKTPELFWGVIASMYLGNILLLVLNLPFVGVFAKVMSVRTAILVPLIVAVMGVGCYSLNGSAFDVMVMFVAGIIGYFMRHLGLEPMPLVLGVVLGQLIEFSYVQTALMYEGSWIWLVTRPIPLALTVVCLLVVGFKTVFKRKISIPTEGAE